LYASRHDDSALNVERLASLRAAKDFIDGSYARALDLEAIAREAD
jgi:hypothetical protein